MNRRHMLVLGAGALGAIGLAMISTTASAKAVISGAFSFRERLAMLPGATGIVTLADISRADAASIELARQEINLSEHKMPYKFSLSVSGDQLKPGHSYTVGVKIISPSGKLMFVSDQINMVTPGMGSQSVGLIQLVKVGG